jgi:hypothetical protein
MTDSELLDHAVAVTEAKEDAMGESAADVRRATFHDLRREHIRDVLKARVRRRRSGDTDSELADLAVPLEEVIYNDRAEHTPT